MEKSPLNILMVTPLSAGMVRGGVRMQSLKTSEYLEKTGHHITYYNPWKIYHPEEFDIVHLFLAGNETLTISQKLSNLNVKFVVSPVFYTRRSASVIRHTINIQDIGSQIIKGVFSDYSIKADVCKNADLLLPNTEMEARLIRDGFDVQMNKVNVVPNGVDLRFERATPDLFHKKYDIRDFTLFVGDGSARRKNLLPLLKSHSSHDPPLVIIGTLDQSDYSNSCRQIINESGRIHYLGPMDHDAPMLESAYAAATVFTLPSHFETPGIAALEAALAGCTIAITNVGGTHEYFKEYADYIDPKDHGTIMKAIRKAHRREKTDKLRNHIKTNFTWPVVAEKTEQAYRSIL